MARGEHCKGKDDKKGRRIPARASASVVVSAEVVEPAATVELSEEAPHLSAEAAEGSAPVLVEEGPTSEAWWYPNDFLRLESRQFERKYGIDPAVAIRLCKDPGAAAPGEDFFAERYRWYKPNRKMIPSPEDTCKGMNGAGRMIADALRSGKKIAVFADYDPDGTCAAEAFRQLVAPYCAMDCADCEGDGTIDCPRCEGEGKIDGKRCPRHCSSGSLKCKTCAGSGEVPNPDQILIQHANAEDGFGLTQAFVKEAAASGAEILVTLDCGSSQVAEIAAAKAAGLKCVVVDHHDVDDSNPADFHLNPLLHRINPVYKTDDDGKFLLDEDGEKILVSDEPMSHNTGAQLAWKLGVAVQMATEGKTLPEAWETPLYLAGFGARADMGSVLLPENRAFMWYGLDRTKGKCVPPGLAMLAEAMGEDPTNPGNLIMTSAAMNMSKRSPRASAGDVGRMLAAETAEEAAEYVDKILAIYKEGAAFKKEMNEKAVELVTAQVEAEEAELEAGLLAVQELDEYDVRVPSKGKREKRNTTPHTLRAWLNDNRAGKRFATVVLDDWPEWGGYSGIVANHVSRKGGRPGAAFCYKGQDQFGQEMYKFSLRNESRWKKQKLGDLLHHDEDTEAIEWLRMASRLDSADRKYLDLLTIDYPDKDERKQKIKEFAERRIEAELADQEQDPYAWLSSHGLITQQQQEMIRDTYGDASSPGDYDKIQEMAREWIDLHRFEPPKRRLRRACTFLKMDSEGRPGEDTSLGGHVEVVSGNCTKENVKEVQAALEQWAHECATVRGMGGWTQNKPFGGPSEYLAERYVDGKRLKEIEKQALRLAPFSVKDQHRPLSVSVEAKLDEPTLDEETGYMMTTLKVGTTKRVAMLKPERVEVLPRNDQGEIHGEFVLTIDQPGRYFLRAWSEVDEEIKDYGAGAYTDTTSSKRKATTPERSIDPEHISADEKLEEVVTKRQSARDDVDDMFAPFIRA